MSVSSPLQLFLRLSPSAAPFFGPRQRRSIQPALRQNISFYAVLFSRSRRSRSIQPVASLSSRSCRSGCCYDCSATPQRFLQQFRTFVPITMMFLLVSVLTQRLHDASSNIQIFSIQRPILCSTATDTPRFSNLPAHGSRISLRLTRNFQSARISNSTF